MARARTKKAKPVRKRAANRRRKVIEQSQSNWQIGAGILALAVILGAGAYMITMNDGARTTVADFVERMEVPQSVKEFPDKVRQNLPDMPSLTNSETNSSAEGNQSAPAQ